MARQARLSVPGELHLLTQRSVSARLGVPDEEAARFWLASLREAGRREQVRLHAWVLGPREWRLLCTPQSPGALAAMLQAMGRVYVPWLNGREGESGSPWVGRFRSAMVDGSTWYLDALVYAEGLLDPLQEALPPGNAAPGMVWSSSAAYHAGEQSCEWLIDHPGHWSLGNTPFEREAAYRALAQGGLRVGAGPRLLALRAALSRGRAVGDEAFLQRIQQTLGRPMQARGRGRPRKNPATNPSSLQEDVIKR